MNSHADIVTSICDEGSSVPQLTFVKNYSVLVDHLSTITTSDESISLKYSSNKRTECAVALCNAGYRKSYQGNSIPQLTFVKNEFFIGGSFFYDSIS